VIHLVRIAVRVDDPDDRNLQLARLVDRDLLLLRVDHEQRVGQPAHRPDAVQVPLQLALLLLGAGDLLLGHRLVAPVGCHRLEVAQAAQAALDGGEVRQQPAEPALVDVVHPAALGLFGDDVLCLPLRADEQDRPALGREIGEELFRLAEQLDRLAEVDDVDAVALAEDVLLHLRVPALRLVAEMDSGLQQFLHRDSGQAPSTCAFAGRAAAAPACGRPYRLLNWKRLRAPAMPYFFRSFLRASRVRNPPLFSARRSSASNSQSARAMPSRTAPACPDTPPPRTVASTSNR